MTETFPALDVSIVSYRPDPEGFAALLESLARQQAAAAMRLVVWDNSPESEVRERIAGTLSEYSDRFAEVAVDGGEGNLGFGAGHNRNVRRTVSDFVLILNQDLRLEPEAVATLLGHASHEPDVAAWEMRQIPYEHPKIYDPVSLDTVWVSGAATLFRREAFEAVGGFDERIFMYGEDVDLSWRLRASGWRVCYVPQAAAVHETYAYAGEVKPLQVLGGTLTNLCLRARFGSWRQVAKGVAMLIGEMLAPQAFAGRRRGLALNLLKFLFLLPRFRERRWRRNGGFQPIFSGWDYEIRRDGAFFEFHSQGRQGSWPLVSVLVRTHKRPQWLREALTSLCNQTYPNLEVIVVEDGEDTAKEMVEREFTGRLDIRYIATGTPVGRSRAGNLALECARGDWLNFLDDDDVLFADHIEVMLQAAEASGTKGAYGLAWEVPTRIESENPLRYTEVMHLTRHRERFSKVSLWHHNFMPIQSVLFHRSLYERRGGFETDLDQLEDWNLWTRYTLEDDFVLVEKTTSKYRVPAVVSVSEQRQRALDEAYRAALQKQRNMSLPAMSPREVSEMVETYLQTQSVVMVTRNQVREWARRVPLLGWLAAKRIHVARLKRRLFGV